MNRSYYVVMVPVLLVALGYVLMLRHLGFAPGYPRLFVAMALFLGAIWWLGRRAAQNSRTGAR